MAPTKPGRLSGNETGARSIADTALRDVAGMDQLTTIALLARTPLFREIDERGLTRLLNGSVVRQVPKGTALFAEGDTPEMVHVLLTGRVALIATGGTEHRTVVTILTEGCMVAVAPMLLRLPCPVGAVATVQSRVLALDAAVLLAEIAHQPILARAVLAMLARQWCGLIEQMKDLKLRDSRSRVARWLVQSATGAGESAVELAAPKAMLARNLGMTPESFSRALAALEAAGAISASGSAISILDRALLEEHHPSRHS